MDRWKCQLFSLFVRRMSKSAKEHAEVRTKKKKNPFMDSLRVYVRGGAGGQGLPRFGGVGGNGGNVVAVADQKQNLQHLPAQNPTKRYIAGTGKNSRKFHLLGDNGNDVTILVPVGVVVKRDDGQVLADLDSAGQSVVLAQGGRGGNPQNSFLGQKGAAHIINLDLKLIADIGLVGFPNAGKSTFLKACSRANPKIASYPFTTIRPQLGVMEYPDFRKITVADLPGLIEGAHVNFGMGHKFLKHIERTKMLLFMVDINGFQLRHEYKHRTAFETVLLLIKELELYREELIHKPAVLAVNKVDEELPQSSEMLEELLELIQGLPGTLKDVDPKMHPENLVQFDDVISISAKYGHNIEQLKDRLRTLLDVHDDLSRLEDRTETAVTVAEKSDSRIPRRFQEHAKIKLV